MSLIRSFRTLFTRNEDGQALVEYGLILSLIALVAITGLTAVGGGVDGLYGTMTSVTDAMITALGG